MNRHLAVGMMAALIIATLAGVSSATLINVAPLGTTSTSTVGFGLPPENAINLNYGDVSHTATGDLAPFWEVDLGEEFLIESINVFNRTACCGERLYNVTLSVLDAFDSPLYTSDVLNPWDGVDPAAPVSPGDGPFLFDFSGMPGGGIAGNKVRVNKDAFAGSEWLSLAEVEVFANIETDNVALMKPVTATGPVYANWSTAALTDGSIVGQIHSAAQVTTYAYEIDLGEEIELGSINVWGRQDECCADRLADYRVSVHEDDGGMIGAEVWSADLVGQGSILGAPDTFLAADGAGTFTGQWIRIDRIDDTVLGDYVLQIAEVEAYAVPEPSTFVLLALASLCVLPLLRRQRRLS